MSLTILNLHNNMLKKLPDEIGHLQNLTSLGVIGNKLEYLPIPIASLPHLRALWLTQNQSHPLVSSACTVLMRYILFVIVSSSVFVTDTIADGKVGVYGPNGSDVFPVASNTSGARGQAIADAECCGAEASHSVHRTGYIEGAAGKVDEGADALSEGLSTVSALLK